MTKKTAAPLRGDAAWQAARLEMSRRNDAARDRRAADRAEHAAHVATAREQQQQRAEDASRHVVPAGTSSARP